MVCRTRIRFDQPQCLRLLSPPSRILDALRNSRRPDRRATTEPVGWRKIARADQTRCCPFIGSHAQSHRVPECLEVTSGSSSISYLPSSMSDSIISVENLGKKYRIQHNAERQRYTALRDVIAQKFAAPFKFLRRSKIADSSSGLSPISHLLALQRAKIFGRFAMCHLKCDRAKSSASSACPVK